MSKETKKRTYEVVETPIWNVDLKVGDTFEAELTEAQHKSITTPKQDGKRGHAKEVKEAKGSS